MARAAVLAVLAVIWAIAAALFGYFGLSGFVERAQTHGFRRSLCGSEGCTDLEFFLSAAWLAGMIIAVYVLPIVLGIYLLRRKRV